MIALLIFILYDCMHIHSRFMYLCIHVHPYTYIHAHTPSSYPYWTRPAALSPMPPSRSPTPWPAPPSSLSRSSRAPSRGSRNSSSFFVVTTRRMSSSTHYISYCWASTLGLGRLTTWSLLQSKLSYIMYYTSRFTNERVCFSQRSIIPVL